MGKGPILHLTQAVRGGWTYKRLIRHLQEGQTFGSDYSIRLELTQRRDNKKKGVNIAVVDDEGTIRYRLNNAIVRNRTKIWREYNAAHPGSPLDRRAMNKIADGGDKKRQKTEGDEGVDIADGFEGDVGADDIADDFDAEALRPLRCFLQRLNELKVMWYLKRANGKGGIPDGIMNKLLGGHYVERHIHKWCEGSAQHAGFDLLLQQWGFDPSKTRKVDETIGGDGRITTDFYDLLQLIRLKKDPSPGQSECSGKGKKAKGEATCSAWEYIHQQGGLGSVPEIKGDERWTSLLNPRKPTECTMCVLEERGCRWGLHVASALNKAWPIGEMKRHLKAKRKKDGTAMPEEFKQLIKVFKNVVKNNAKHLLKRGCSDVGLGTGDAGEVQEGQIALLLTTQFERVFEGMEKTVGSDVLRRLFGLSSHQTIADHPLNNIERTVTRTAKRFRAIQADAADSPRKQWGHVGIVFGEPTGYGMTLRLKVLEIDRSADSYHR